MSELTERNCPECGKRFMPKQRRQRFDRDFCRNAFHYRERQKLVEAGRKVAAA